MPFALDPRARPYADEIVKRSRFVARLRRADHQADADELIAFARQHDRGANHHCFASIIGDDDSRVERSSDDGEPGGTAGAPMLQVLRSRDLVNVVAVVSRYFGGVKLGTGGLARAYGGAVAVALEGADLHPRSRMEVFRLSVEHAEAGRVESELRRRGFDVTEVEYDERATIALSCSDASALRSVIDETLSGRADLVHIGHVWR
jgi:uncharacterized YigZ family protein